MQRFRAQLSHTPNFAFHISYTASTLISAAKREESRVTACSFQIFFRLTRGIFSPGRGKQFPALSLSKSPRIIGDQVHVANPLPRCCSRRQQMTSFKMIDAVIRHVEQYIASILCKTFINIVVRTSASREAITLFEK